MKTNTNSLTEVQVKAIKGAIADSMRKSLSKSNLIYDVNFDSMIDFITNNIIENAQNVLGGKTKNVVIANKKKNARK